MAEGRRNARRFWWDRGLEARWTWVPVSVQRCRGLGRWHHPCASKYSGRQSFADSGVGCIDPQVAGKWLKGAKLRGGSGGSLAQKLVGLGYQQVCGDPEVWGDGITPVSAAHLEGKLLQLSFSNVLTNRNECGDTVDWCNNYSCASAAVLDVEAGLNLV